MGRSRRHWLIRRMAGKSRLAVISTDRSECLVRAQLDGILRHSEGQVCGDERRNCHGDFQWFDHPSGGLGATPSGLDPSGSILVEFVIADSSFIIWGDAQIGCTWLFGADLNRSERPKPLLTFRADASLCHAAK